MAALADGFVALPGGFGTLEELLEMVTWAQLGLHRKPIGLLNVAGYYDALIRLVEHAVAERFVHPGYGALLLAREDVPGLLDAITRWEPPATPRTWLTLDET